MKRKNPRKKVPNITIMRNILSDEGLIEREFGYSYQPSAEEVREVFEEYNDENLFRYTSKKELSKAYRTRKKPVKSKTAKTQRKKNERKKRGKKNGRKTNKK